MPKTYGTVTTFTAGSVLTAAQLNVASGAVNNLVVPATCQVRRTTNLTSYTQYSAITWSDSAWDTDSMWSSGANTRITINTAGIYIVTFTGQITGTGTITLVDPAIFVSGATSTAEHYASVSGGTTGAFSIAVTLNLAAADYLTAGVGISGGSAYSVSGNASAISSQTRLTATWIGRTS